MLKKVSLFITVFLLTTSFAYAETVQLPRTGQTPPGYDANIPKRDDGALQRGVAWPTPRFIDHGNGTVTDNLTGLMWTKNANLPGGTRTWQQALNYVVSMNAGAGTYGHTDWRLPNRKELRSLIDYSRFSPALPSGHPFTNVASNFYWSSSTYAADTDYAWFVFMPDGYVLAYYKTTSYYVWPVRAGQ